MMHQKTSNWNPPKGSVSKLLRSVIKCHNCGIEIGFDTSLYIPVTANTNAANINYIQVIHRIISGYNRLRLLQCLDKLALTFILKSSFPCWMWLFLKTQFSSLSLIPIADNDVSIHHFLIDSKNCKNSRNFRLSLCEYVDDDNKQI